MCKTDKHAYGSSTHSLVLGLAVLLLATAAHGYDPDPRCEVEKAAAARRGTVIDQIVLSAGFPFSIRQGEIARKIHELGVSSARPAIAELTDMLKMARLSRDGNNKAATCLSVWLERLKVSLELLQCVPDSDSVPVLRELSQRDELLDRMRTEVLFTMCLQPGGFEYVEQCLESPNDEVRGAAILAWSRVVPVEDVATLVRETRAQEGYLSGTHTGNALEGAQSMVDTAQFLAATPGFDDKLRFLLSCSVYAPAPVPLGADLYYWDPGAVYVWEQLRSLWREDSARVRKVIERKIKHYDQARYGRYGRLVLELLLEDLPAEICPPYDPRRPRPTGEE